MKKEKLTKYFILEKKEKEIKEETVKLSSIARAHNKVNEMLNEIYTDYGKIGKLVEGMLKEASTNILDESEGDWFDKITVKRNITEMNKRGKDFIKTFEELKASSLRLQALHEEIGFILNRYINLGE